MTEWEKSEQWLAVEKEMAAARERGVKVVEEKRDEKGRFRSYKVEALDVENGRT